MISTKSGNRAALSPLLRYGTDPEDGRGESILRLHPVPRCVSEPSAECGPRNDCQKLRKASLGAALERRSGMTWQELITAFTPAQNNVAAMVASGRARWQTANENNHTLKTKGCHLEHNFGLGQKHLSSLLGALKSWPFSFTRCSPSPTPITG